MKLKFKRGFGCPGEMHVQLRLVLEVDSDRWGGEGLLSRWILCPLRRDYNPSEGVPAECDASYFICCFCRPTFLCIHQLLFQFSAAFCIVKQFNSFKGMWKVTYLIIVWFDKSYLWTEHVASKFKMLSTYGHLSYTWLRAEILKRVLLECSQDINIESLICHKTSKAIVW